MPFPEEDDDPGFLQRHRGLVILAIVIVLGVVVTFAGKLLSGKAQSSGRQSEVMVSLPPLPPPPPPKLTPTPPPPTEQPTPDQQQDPKQMEEQPTVQKEEKPEAPKEKADAPLGTGITGPGGGPDLGLGSGLGGGGGYGGGGGGGSKYGWYASQVQSRIADAVRGNPRTRKASMNVVIRIWPDPNGRITKARLSGSTGDPALDATIRNEILTGLQLSDPPPADMPLPIVMRLTAQRP